MTFDQILQICNMLLQFAYFGLMCVGLLLASIFLYLELISGSDWSILSGILFGTGGFGHALVNFGAAKK